MSNLLNNILERTASNVLSHRIMDRISKIQENIADKAYERADDELPRKGKRGKPLYPLISRPTPFLDIIRGKRKYKD